MKVHLVNLKWNSASLPTSIAIDVKSLEELNDYFMTEFKQLPISYEYDNILEDILNYSGYTSATAIDLYTTDCLDEDYNDWLEANKNRFKQTNGVDERMFFTFCKKFNYNGIYFCIDSEGYANVKDSKGNELFVDNNELLKAKGIFNKDNWMYVLSDLLENRDDLYQIISIDVG